MRTENARAWADNAWVDLDFEEMSIEDLLELEEYVKEEMTNIKHQIQRKEIVDRAEWTIQERTWFVSASTAYKRRSNRLTSIQQTRAQKERKLRIEQFEQKQEEFLSKFFSSAKSLLEKETYELILKSAKS
tara:strand:+ start:4516 stop:4908 length:393 start_codon:yes stop_codon:yes gene_type:complete